MSQTQKIKSTTKKIVQNSLIYLINDEEKTACIIGNKGFIDKIIIPRLINYCNRFNCKFRFSCFE